MDLDTLAPPIKERLASLVTRDCMIGTGLPRRPEGAAS